MMTRSGLAARRVVLALLGLLLLAMVAAGMFYGPVIADFARAGFFNKVEKQAWSPETEKNLQALHTALKLHHESEGVYPKAEGWMDKIEPRVRTNTLAKEEARKKFIDPNAGGGDAFGFAYNEAAGDKYIDDLPRKGDTILLFQSTETGWNAHGDPAKIGRPGGIGITADGKVVPLNANAK